MSKSLMTAVKIYIHHLPTDKTIVGYETINDIKGYEVLKGILIEAVEGKVSFLKIVDESKRDIIIGRDLLVNSTITLEILS